MRNRIAARVGLGLLILSLIAACARSSPPVHALVLLSRDGCMMTAPFQANLDAAIQSLGRSIRYEVVDLGTLASTDPRVGYPTPTLLADGRDVFGLPEPRPPLPEPT